MKRVFKFLALAAASFSSFGLCSSGALLSDSLLSGALSSGALSIGQFAFAASSQKSIRLNGRVALWSREKCSDSPACLLPQPFGQTWNLSLEFEPFTEQGARIIADTTLQQANWTVEILMLWVNPPEGATPYITTQIRLSEHVLGLIAECSRFDGINDFKFLPPGSCAGRNGDKTYGVSLMTPAQ